MFQYHKNLRPRVTGENLRPRVTGENLRPRVTGENLRPRVTMVTGETQLNNVLRIKTWNFSRASGVNRLLHIPYTPASTLADPTVIQ